MAKLVEFLNRKEPRLSTRHQAPERTACHLSRNEGESLAARPQATIRNMKVPCMFLEETLNIRPLLLTEMEAFGAVVHRYPQGLQAKDVRFPPLQMLENLGMFWTLGIHTTCMNMEAPIQLLFKRIPVWRQNWP